MLRLSALLCALLLWVSDTTAATLDARIHGYLDSAQGWSHHSDSDGGITVYSKDIPGIDVPAYKGIKTLPAGFDTTKLFDLICDLEGHLQVTGSLFASVMVDSSLYYQVLKPPPMLPSSQRFWINRSQTTRNMQDTPGWNRRSWSSVSRSEAAEVRAAIHEQFPESMEVAQTHGTWELVPQRDGSTLYIYRAVSDPGGSIPSYLASKLAAHTLPDNMLSFERAAR